MPAGTHGVVDYGSRGGFKGFDGAVGADVCGVVRWTELCGAGVVEFVGDLFVCRGAEEAAGVGDVFRADRC